MRKKKDKTPLKFIDLFAGLGGFHLALGQMGCECVFASELREDLRRLYAINFPEMNGKTDSGINKIEGDITTVAPRDIPDHDILCAGFPCQPFSQAGKRLGFNDDKDRGNLFYNICDIIDAHRPRYVLLENVSNLKGHDEGNTWKTIKEALESRRYKVMEALLSPHQFNIPQHRRRIYIVCENEDFGCLDGFEFPKEQDGEECNIRSIIDPDETEYQHLKTDTRHQLDVWREFLGLCVDHHVKVPSFPIWAMEFGATYDYEDGRTPSCSSLEQLRGAKGTLGMPITGRTRKRCLACIPLYSGQDVTSSPHGSKSTYSKIVISTRQTRSGLTHGKRKSKTLHQATRRWNGTAELLHLHWMTKSFSSELRAYASSCLLSRQLSIWWVRRYLFSHGSNFRRSQGWAMRKWADI